MYCIEPDFTLKKNPYSYHYLYNVDNNLCLAILCCFTGLFKYKYFRVQTFYLHELYSGCV